MKRLAAQIFDFPNYSLIVIGLLMFSTIVLELTETDLYFPSLFYDEMHNKWLYLTRPQFLIFDNVATVPGLTMGISSMVVALIYALSQKSWQPFRNEIFLLLVLALGPGLLVNGCKGVWGRPRPHDLVNYGGTHQYHAFWTWDTDRLNCCSFPSGHASMGFYLLTPMFLLRRRKPKLAASVFFLGLFAGFLTGSSRIIQGSYFLTDVIWSACFVFISATVLDRILFTEKRSVPLPISESTPEYPVSKAA